MADGSEEAALFRESAAVADDAESVHLQAVVVEEAERLVLDHAGIELELALFQALAGARMAGVQDRHVILLGQAVDRREEAGKVLFRVDILFAVGREQDVFSLLQAEPCVDVGRLDRDEILRKHLRHRGAGDVGPLLRQTAVGQIAARVLGIGQIDVRDDVHDAAVGLLRQALVLAAVAGFHVEDRDVQSLGADHGQTAVRVAENEHSVRLELDHRLVRGGNDVAHRLTEVRADGVQIQLRRVQTEISEEDAVERIVIVLAGMDQQRVEILPALFDDGGKADDLRARAHDDHQLDLTVFFPRNHKTLLFLAVSVTMNSKISNSVYNATTIPAY